MTRSRLSLLATILLTLGTFAACGGIQMSPPRPVYKDAGTAVELRVDRQAADPGHSHPVRLTPEQMVVILNGVRVQKRSDPILSLVTGEPETVHAFSVEEVRTLAPILSQALAMTSPRELVTFYRRISDESIGFGFTSGGLFVEHKALCFILANHRNRPADGMGHMQAITYEIDPVDNPLFSVGAMSFAVSFAPADAIMSKVLRPQWEYEDPGKVVVVDLERLLIQPVSLPPAPPLKAPR